MANNGPLFGDRLRDLRKLHGYSQQRLADELRMSQSGVYAYEKAAALRRGESKDGNFRGSAYPSMEVAIKLARLFNVSVDYLVGLDEDSAPKGRREDLGGGNDISNIDSGGNEASINKLELLFRFENMLNAEVSEIGLVGDDGDILALGERLNGFLEERVKMKELLSSGAIRQSMYDLWLQEEMEVWAGEHEEDGEYEE